MATTQNTYTGNGSTTDYTLTFPYLAVADIRVSLDDVGTTAFSLANPTTLRFDSAPGNGVAIRIYRVTDDSNNKIVFSSGSSIKADDLNDAVNRNLYIAQETTNDLSNVTAGAVSDGSLTTAKLADDAVTTSKIGPSAVTTPKIADANITTAKIADANVTTAKIADSNVTTAKIADDAVDDTKLSNTGVTSGTYAGANITVNEQGRITSAGAGLFTGMIMMFQGATAPSGWAFCDGQNGTPDLRDRFIVGSGSTYSLNATGGTANAVLIAHSHDYVRNLTTQGVDTDSHGHDDTVLEDTQTVATTTVGFDSSGAASTTQTGTNANLPPYYALAFIIKL